MDHHFILRVVAKMLMPPIMLYALYVQFHGDFGPGGGFQAGVIFAVAFLLYALVFRLASLRRVAPPAIVRAGIALGVLLYAGTGAFSLFKGKNFIDYSALADADHAVGGQHLGILLVEAGVGLTVASVMIAVFMAFAARAPEIKDTDW